MTLESVQVGDEQIVDDADRRLWGFRDEIRIDLGTIASRSSSQTDNEETGINVRGEPEAGINPMD